MPDDILQAPEEQDLYAYALRDRGHTGIVAQGGALRVFFSSEARVAASGRADSRLVTVASGSHRAVAFAVRQRDAESGTFNASGGFEFFDSLTAAPEFRSVRAGEQFPSDGPLRRVR